MNTVQESFRFEKQRKGDGGVLLLLGAQFCIWPNALAVTQGDINYIILYNSLTGGSRGALLISLVTSKNSSGNETKLHQIVHEDEVCNWCSGQSWEQGPWESSHRHEPVRVQGKSG